jgi:hypothetical protein
LATQFFPTARSGIKIANLLKYSFGSHVLGCSNVAIATNISWAFYHPLRSKMRTSSQCPSKKKPPKKTKRVSTKMEALRLLAIPVRIPVT